jgi:hypothetical protein
MTNVTVIRGLRMYRIGSIAGGEETRVDFQGNGDSYVDFARNWSTDFTRVAGRRTEVFGGGDQDAPIDNWGDAAIAASFAQHVTGGDNSSRQFIWPPTFDLTPNADRGDLIILAYLPGDSVLPAMNRFSALRQAKGTLVRLVLPASR